MCCLNKSVFGCCCCCCNSDTEYSDWKEGKEPNYVQLSRDLRQAMKGLGTDEKKNYFDCWLTLLC